MNRVNYKDLRKWINDNGQQLYEELQEFWETDFPHPRINITTSGGTGYSSLDSGIYLNVNQISGLIDHEIRHGLYDTVDKGLRTIFGEETTHYLNDKSASQNIQRADDIRIQAYKERSPRLLLNSVSVGGQVEGIAKIGSQEVSGVHPNFDHLLSVLDMLNNTRQSLDAFDSNISKIDTEIATGMLLKMAIKVHRYVTSVAGVRIVDIFRDRYNGKFGELIRADLKPDQGLDSILIETIRRVPEFNRVYKYFNIQV